MKNYIIRRLLQIIPVFLGILFILFFHCRQSTGRYHIQHYGPENDAGTEGCPEGETGP